MSANPDHINAAADAVGAIEAQIVNLSLHGQPQAATTPTVPQLQTNSTGIKRGFFDRPKPTTPQEDKDLLIRVYSEAPNDVLEYILSLVSGRLGRSGGAYNLLRLVNHRIKGLVENSTTRVLWKAEDAPGPISFLPASLFRRTRRLGLISCDSPILDRLDGLPSSLKELHVTGESISSGALQILPTSCPNLTLFLIVQGRMLFDASPLGGCRHLKHVYIKGSRITDLSFLSQLPDLEHLALASDGDESPLGNDDAAHIAGCTSLRGLALSNQRLVTDVSFISKCTRLSQITISGCDELSDISSIASCLDLVKLDITHTSVLDLSPLRGLARLTRVMAYEMLKGFSVQELSHCPGLTEVHITDGAEGVEEVKNKFGPRLRVYYDHDK